MATFRVLANDSYTRTEPADRVAERPGDARQSLAYEFGSFRVDPSERLLLRDGRLVPVTPKAFNLLVYLLERHGRLVDKATLMTELWPDATVEEGQR